MIKIQFSPLGLSFRFRPFYCRFLSGLSFAVDLLSIHGPKGIRQQIKPPAQRWKLSMAPADCSAIVHAQIWIVW
jgi:hypothetical protein